MLAFATAAPRQKIIGASAQCDRTDIYLAYTAYDTAYDGLCGFVNLVQLSPSVAGPPAWAEARAAIAARGLRLGTTWLMAGFRARTRAQGLEVRYYFPPPALAPPDGDGWAESAWSPARIDADPAKAAAIERLAVWSAWTRGFVEDGLRGRLDPATRLPWPWGAGDLARELIETRLKVIDRLAAEGAISSAAYAEQRQKLDAIRLAPERAETAVWLHALWKTATYKVVSTLDTIGVTYLVLGSIAQSGAFTLIGNTVRPAANYLHEVIWTYSGYGYAPPALGSTDFAEIGLDQ
ncbi:MAG: DUF2061 domain-containing protein [Dongiaceae bacterium]